MILFFLGSWRSTVIIIISIPLSILFSVVALSALGETINVMTFGGLLSPSACWSMKAPSPWRTSSTIWNRANRSSRRSWTARSRSSFLPS